MTDKPQSPADLARELHDAITALGIHVYGLAPGDAFGETNARVLLDVRQHILLVEQERDAARAQADARGELLDRITRCLRVDDAEGRILVNSESEDAADAIDQWTAARRPLNPREIARAMGDKHEATAAYERALAQLATVAAERDAAREALQAQCFDHADNCCREWCARCQRGHATKEAALNPASDSGGEHG